MKKLSINTDIMEYSSDIFRLRRFLKESADEDETEPIELTINSYGGDAFLGASIHNELKSYPAEVTAVVTGIAASAASAIAMGADKIKMHKNAMLMLHNPWTVAMGNSTELRKAADDLEKVQVAMEHNYTERVALDTLRPLLDEETYLTADEALELGLVDEVVEQRAEKVESKLFAAKVEEVNAILDRNQPAAGANPQRGGEPELDLSEKDVARIAAMVAQNIQNYTTTEPDEDGTTEIEPAETIEEQRENEKKQTEDRKEGQSLLNLLIK